jgi:hypothetical protein
MEKNNSQRKIINLNSLSRHPILKKKKRQTKNE